MSYSLGIDIGTTYTAAATVDVGRPEVALLGRRRAEIPSLIYLSADGGILVGDAAERRGADEPNRLAREFKRRIGDPVPLLLGGTPYPAHILTARLLRSVVDAVSDQRDARPDVVTVTHPANWGPYKMELFDQTIQLADVENVTILSEPEAAAVWYASTDRVADGDIVAVYDLGGGTFDVAILQKQNGGFAVRGQPDGIEQLGGIDFDEAAFGHVIGSLGLSDVDLEIGETDMTDALSRLRQDCVAAKEALSYDTAVTIPVSLPARHSRIRLTRHEFEAMIAPRLGDTIAATRRALRSAAVSPDELSAVVLAGGSSRIPLITELIEQEFGAIVVTDPHPEHSVALGAAQLSPASGKGIARREPRRSQPPERVVAHQAPAVVPGRHDSPPVPTRPHRPRWLVPVAVVATAIAVVVAAVVLSRPQNAAPPPATEAPAGPSWTRVQDLPLEAEGVAAATFQGRIWAVGGISNDENRTKLNTSFVYDPSRNTWTSGPALPRPLSHAALVSNGTDLFLIGGWIQSGGSREVLRLNRAHDGWVRDDPLPQPRVAGAAGWDGARIIFAGGTRPDQSAADEVWAKGRHGWTELGTLLHGRQKLSAVTNSVDTIWFLGGRDQRTEAKFGDVERFTQGRPAPVNAAIEPPRDSAAAVRIDGIGLCTIGGQVSTGNFGDWWCEKPNAAAELPKLNPQRAGMAVARIGKTIYVIGGYGADFDGTARVESFTP